MVLELFMKIIFTPKLFFDSYFEVFDGVLVLVAFGLDVTLMFDVDLPIAICKCAIFSCNIFLGHVHMATHFILLLLSFSFHRGISILENHQTSGWNSDHN